MSFEYPSVPVVGVGAVIVRDGRVLIIRRAHEPRKGEWSLPGGKVELGETMTEAVRREMKEETGLDVDVGPLVELFDRVHRDAEGRVRYHFVIADFLCVPIGGQEQAGDDADALAWAGADDLAAYHINRHAIDVILKGLALV
jgi:8-oxo-dGTP diphosphatase